MRQLTALDAQFLAIESGSTYGHVSGLAILDPSTAPKGRLNLDDLKTVLAERLHMLPPLTERLAEVPFGIDHPYWIEDPDFDLDYHVRELALSPPGSDKQLGDQVARLFSRQLDRARPLWELYLIHGLPDGRVGMFTKIHHALVDGMSGAEIMGILYDLEPSGREIEPPEAKSKSGDAPGALEMLGRGVAGLPRQPLRLLRSLPTTIPNLDVAPSVLGIPGAETMSRTLSRARNAISRQSDGEVVERPRMRAPRVSFGRKISPHRQFAFGSLPLASIKRVKNHYGVTVNDVVVALSAAATRDWLIAHGELPDEPLLAQIPVSVRTDEQSGTFGNRISVMIVPIPTDVADPVDRLHAAHESMGSAKTRHKALPAEALQDITNFIPPAINARAARVMLQLSASKAMRPLYNMVISNVPGPPIPIYMAGARLEHNYPVSVITNGAGLNITVLSYLDRVDFGIVADREQMPDLDDLIGTLKAELAALEADCPA